LCDLIPINVKEVFGGQYLCIEALTINHTRGKIHREYADYKIDYVNAFSSLYSRKVDEWKEKLEDFNQDGRRVVIWGAGSKGVTFLNATAIGDQIEYIVDINPHKRGKHIPGTGQKIMPPEFLTEYRPEFVVIMNPLYFCEVQQVVKKMEVRTTLLKL
jgi:hypothetical protein